MAETVEKILDANGWPILEGCRVYVPERPGLDGHGTVAGFGGFVKSVTEDVVEVEELLSFHARTVRPHQCKVQSGDTKASLEHRALAKGGRQYINDRKRDIAMREERNARKAAQGETDAA